MLNVKEIEAIIPHRHPFLLIDTIEDYEPGVFAIGYKCVTFREDFFQGHFPGNPIMPGVLILEAMAQVGGVMLLNNLENAEDYWVYFYPVMYNSFVEEWILFLVWSCERYNATDCSNRSAVMRNTSNIARSCLDSFTYTIVFYIQ